MSQAQLLPSSSAPSFPPLAYKGTPVLTTEMLAQAYEVEPHQIRQNFKNNRERFIEGKHFFSVSGQELKNFRLCVENFYSQISTKVRVLILYTDRGCARHAKSLNTDRAWDMYELLEETFFAVVKSERPISEPVPSHDATISPAQRHELKLIVDAKVGMVPKAIQRKAYKEIWTRFNRHFHIAEYKQLPCSHMDEARDFLLSTQVNAGKAVELPQTALPLPQGYERIDEKPFLEFIAEVQAAHEEVVRILSRLHHSVFTLSWKVAEALEHRADIRLYLVPEMLSENTLRGYLHQSVYHDVKKALTAPGRQLEEYSNPGYSLLGIVRQLNDR